MTSVVLLEQLKAFTEKIMADMILPVAMQQGDTEQAYRAPEVYLMRLPDSRAAKKKAPYIIHRVIPLETEQQPGSEERTVVSVRSIFCCYNPDEQEGDLALLNMMERFRVELLKVRKVGAVGADGKPRYQFTLDISPDHKLESIPYDEESKPYYTRTSTQSDSGLTFPVQSRRASSVPQASQMYTPLAWRLSAPWVSLSGILSPQRGHSGQPCCWS